MKPTDHRIAVKFAVFVDPDALLAFWKSRHAGQPFSVRAAAEDVRAFLSTHGQADLDVALQEAIDEEQHRNDLI